VTGIADELRAQIQQDAEVKVRAGLLMAEVAKKEGVQVTETDIEEGLKELAEQTGKNVNKVRAEYRDQQRRQMLIGMILENKVLDIIQSKAKIEEG
jgi:trigger factor